MDNILKILDEVIDIKFKLQNNGGKIVFKETQQTKDKCEKVEIYTSKKVFALSLDNEYDVFNCFNNSLNEDRNLNKKNDGILIFGLKQPATNYAISFDDNIYSITLEKSIESDKNRLFLGGFYKYKTIDEKSFCYNF